MLYNSLPVLCCRVSSSSQWLLVYFCLGTFKISLKASLHESVFYLKLTSSLSKSSSFI